MLVEIKRASTRLLLKFTQSHSRKTLTLEAKYATWKSMKSYLEVQIFNTAGQAFLTFWRLEFFVRTIHAEKREDFSRFSFLNFYIMKTWLTLWWFYINQRSGVSSTEADHFHVSLLETSGVIKFPPPPTQTRKLFFVDFAFDSKSDEKRFCTLIPTPKVSGVTRGGHAWASAGFIRAPEEK